MKSTGSRLPAKKAQDKAVVLAGDYGRQARVTELRAMVKSKSYRVDPQHLAVRILARALSHSE
jgi:anti-sigma28 factor (negative regulator of flagellin synthesis)